LNSTDTKLEPFAVFKYVMLRLLPTANTEAKPLTLPISAAIEDIEEDTEEVASDGVIIVDMTTLIVVFAVEVPKVEANVEANDLVVIDAVEIPETVIADTLITAFAVTETIEAPLEATGLHSANNTPIEPTAEAVATLSAEVVENIALAKSVVDTVEVPVAETGEQGTMADASVGERSVSSITAASLYNLDNILSVDSVSKISASVAITLSTSPAS
jgi:hypothetical protein